MKSILSYADVQSLLDRAMAAKNGISISLPHGQAIRIRQRCYQLRKLLREKSYEIYKPGDFMYNRTPYDELTFPNPIDAKKDVVVEMRIEKGKNNLEVKEL